MGATSKQRTPSRCREWEKERRHKFNEAISKLGDLVKSALKDSQQHDEQNVQFAKIEIIQKAIIVIKDCVDERSRLKSEILSLEIKLKTSEKKTEKKDVCTQISIVERYRKKGVKFNKILEKRKKSCDKSSITAPVHALEPVIKNTIEDNTKVSACNNVKNLPTILPKPSNKKGPENTYVVVPAAPYVLPQRPLFLPASPAFVLLNPNMQTLNKTSIPVINKTTNDVTKTTMVNILPISAYSRPLSAIRNKNRKQKPEISKKKTKIHEKVVQKVNDTKKNQQYKKSEVIQTAETTVDVGNKHKDTDESKEKTIPNSTASKVNEVVQVETTESNKSISEIKVTSSDIVQSKTRVEEKNETINLKNNNTSTVESSNANSTPDFVPCIDKESNKTKTEKKDLIEEKQSKLTNILDTTLCEHTVDGGNARLELAEELLAASPTAAFLMSFPLVSGNRADSPAEEPHLTQTNVKYNQKRNDTQPQQPFYEKTTNVIKDKTKKELIENPSTNREQVQNKLIDTNKKAEEKVAVTVAISTTADMPFLNIPLASAAVSSCTFTEPSFILDFECNISKPLTTQSTYTSANNIFYKNDNYNAVKNSIYSTSSISSGHDFNSLGLYPCAMEKFTNKSKADYTSVDDNLMKNSLSRLTYDIDLGWSHKGLDFVNCSTTAVSLNKDSILNTVSSSYNTSYPFNPEFHMPLVSNNNKKDQNNRPTSSFADTISSYYSQTSGLWSEDVPFYTSSSNNTTKTFPNKNHISLPLNNNAQNIPTPKHNNVKQFVETKQVNESRTDTTLKTPMTVMAQLSERYTKKSPSKMHINWMTSEIRPVQNTCNTTHSNSKEISRTSYDQFDQNIKKNDNTHNNNYFPIPVQSYSSQVAQEEFQVWPTTRPLGTTEITIEPPPINLPTLVGDLALGPHEKKKHAEMNRVSNQTDLQNCNNFLSVTQLMNSSMDNLSSRFQISNMEQMTKIPSSKHTLPHYNTEGNCKPPVTRVDSALTHPCYSFNDSKATYENVTPFPNIKPKSSKMNDNKNSKIQKNNYSAEALLRGGTFTQKAQDDKFAMPSQKYGEYHQQQDNSIAQVSHFPPLLDYTDNSYTGQQFSGTNLYNSTTNTISNSFYSNFMPGSSNLMSSNYTGAFTGDYIDYANQTSECNYSNHKYEEFKMKGNLPTFHHEKSATTNHKTSKREIAAKHKLECNKKDSNKRYQNKKAKMSTEVEDWNDNSLLWHNKSINKRHPNLMADELTFPNYVPNQMPSQYQADIFNTSHLMSSNPQGVGHNVDRSLGTFPSTSRANFNLSTIFPEITMKVQT